MTYNFFDDYTEYFDEEEFEENCLQQYEEEMKMEFMKDALAELDMMSEKEACDFYHTDTREEARQSIIEYWTWIA